MAYGESNGHVTVDVTWPRKVKLVTQIGIQRNISKTAGDATIANYYSLPWGSTDGYPIATHLSSRYSVISRPRLIHECHMQSSVPTAKTTGRLSAWPTAVNSQARTSPLLPVACTRVGGSILSFPLSNNWWRAQIIESCHQEASDDTQSHG